MAQLDIVFNTNEALYFSLTSAHCNQPVQKSERMRLIAGCLQPLSHLPCQSRAISRISVMSLTVTETVDHWKDVVPL